MRVNAQEDMNFIYSLFTMLALLAAGLAVCVILSPVYLITALCNAVNRRKG